MNINRVINNIRNSMYIRGWNQTDLAKHSGVLRVTINNILKKKTEPSLKTLTKLADAFDLSLEEFLESNIVPVGSPPEKYDPEMPPEKFLKNINRFLKQADRDRAISHRDDLDRLRVEQLNDKQCNDLLFEIRKQSVADILSVNSNGKNGPSMSPEQEKLVGLISGLNAKQTARAIRFIDTMLSKAPLDESEDGSGSL